MEFLNDNASVISAVSTVAFVASELNGFFKVKGTASITHGAGKFISWLAKAAWRGIRESLAERKANP